MAAPSWKDLYNMIDTLEARIKAAEGDAEEKARVANLLAEIKATVRDECESPDEESDFVQPLLK